MHRCFFLFIVTVIIASCANEKRVTQVDPTLFGDLRGFIEIEKNTYKEGEPILVKYWLTNASDEVFQDQVTDGSVEEEKAFQGYVFNAIGLTNKEDHLTLVNTSKPLSGELEMAVGARKLFTENTFQASKSGSYVLSMTLFWKNQKRIVFTPVNIKIVSKSLLSPSIADDLQSELLKLTSEEPQVRQQAKDKIQQRGASVIPSLVELLNHPNRDLRAELTSLLIEFEEAALPALGKKITHPEPAIRMRIVYIIGEIASVRGFQSLAQVLLKDEDSSIRLEALNAVERHFIDLVDSLMVPLLIRLLSDPEEKIRTRSIQLLRDRTEVEFGFQANGPEEERKATIKKWIEWSRNNL